MQLSGRARRRVWWGGVVAIGGGALVGLAPLLSGAAARGARLTGLSALLALAIAAVARGFERAAGAATAVPTAEFEPSDEWAGRWDGY